MDKEQDSANLKREKTVNVMIAFFGYGPFCLLTMFFLGFFYYERALLITDGVVDRGIVVSYDPSSCESLRSPRTCHYHQISVPDLGSISLDLGSGLIDHIQKITVAAMQMADMKVCAHRS